MRHGQQHAVSSAGARLAGHWWWHAGRYCIRLDRRPVSRSACATALANYFERVLWHCHLGGAIVGRIPDAIAGLALGVLRQSASWYYFAILCVALPAAYSAYQASGQDSSRLGRRAVDHDCAGLSAIAGGTIAAPWSESEHAGLDGGRCRCFFGLVEMGAARRAADRAVRDVP